jgi:predicted MPP superfamily phosphohydrolase
MKTYFMIFFSIVLLLFFSANYFIFHRSLPSVQGLSYKNYLIALFWILVLAYPVGRILESVAPAFAPSVLIKVGSIWLAVMLYLLVGFLIVDILRFINYISGLHLLAFLSDKRTLIIAVIYAITTLLTVIGYINARTPRVSQVEINLPAELKISHPIKIVATSDIHLGTIISNGRLKKLTEMINSQNPDIILLVGDTFDEDLGPVIRNNMGEQLATLKAKYGAYAVTGNHEYYGNAAEAVNYLQNHGITVLQDTSITVGGIVNLIGRNDRQSIRFLGKNRKPLEELVREANQSLPSILMDHQPFNLEEAENNNITLQLSGHTHHGQLWPFNYITGAMFELSSGYLKKGNTHYYVSNGYGTWGPPVRIGNRPEIIVITLK